MNVKNAIMSITLAIFIAIGVSSCSKKPSLNDSANTSVTTTNSNTSLANNTGLTYDTTSNQLRLNGKTFRGIGVNYFDAFYRIILKPSDSVYTKAGLAYLSAKKIPFIRFAASGFWPSDWNMYINNQANYLHCFDRFVQWADSLHIGIIPSLFFNPCTISDLQHEGYGQWGTPNSKTIQMMQQYINTMVTRYKGHTCIWGWEFGNEMNAYVDLYDQSAGYLPKINKDPGAGTPQSRSVTNDSLTTRMMVYAYGQFATAVKAIDKKHLIFTGNAMPEWNMYHRYRDSSGTRWSMDNFAQYEQLLGIQNPASIGTLCVHFYTASTTETGRFTSSDEVIISDAMDAAASLHRPLFVGEFGSPVTTDGQAAEQSRFESELNAIKKYKVQLSALWVFDFNSQTDFNVNYPGITTPKNAETTARFYQMNEIISVNQDWKAQLGY